MENHLPSGTSLNADLQGSHYTLPEGVHFCADSVETWFNSGCVALLGPLPSLGLFSPPTVRRCEVVISNFPSAGRDVLPPVDRASGAPETEILSPCLSSWSGFPLGPAWMPAQFSGRRLITRRHYLLISQTSYLGHKHLGKHIRPNRPGSWDLEPFDKHLWASLGHGGCSRTLLCAHP